MILLFAVSCAFLAYVLFGYPLLLAWLARRPVPVHKRFEPKTVTAILPVHNGEPWLAKKLDSIFAMDYPSGLLDVIIISDGSTDRTAEIARAHAESSPITLIELPRGGKSTALNAGIARATGEILFMTDVRQRLAPASLKALVSCFADPSVGAVSGELILLEGETKAESNIGLYWRYEKWIRKRQGALDSVPGATGAIYALRRNLARPLAPYTLDDDVMLPMAAFFAGYRILFEENAIAYDHPTGLETEFRRKVRTLAGIYQVIHAYPALLVPTNRIWIHFVSHKFARLLLPFALIAIAASCWFLPDPWRTLAVLAQAAVYALAATDTILPEKFPAKKLTSPARTFVVMMAASLAALSIWYRPPQNFWTVPTISGEPVPPES
jgi:poly-beta-1,6-N-acetyl-D-glucosamine synthase